ncbi:MAG: SMC-Scp complex subunit ScpB [Ruminococcaceae bacterium]|nr:SMC-Scp complex subunit ScpB [Oscillospiraceae bacterium]
MLAIAEAVLFAAAEPIEHTRLSIVLGTDSETTLEILDVLKERYEKEESGLCLLKLGSKYQLCSKKEYINEVRAVLDLKRNTPLSQAAFEVLAIIAYNQPITKPYIEQIRGVDCSGVVSTLCQRGLIEEKGRLEVPGRPVLYGTTDDFLRCFSLSALSELEELPNVDKQLLMSDIDSGQLSLFDDGESNDEVKTDEKEPAKVAE